MLVPTLWHHAACRHRLSGASNVPVAAVRLLPLAPTSAVHTAQRPCGMARYAKARLLGWMLLGSARRGYGQVVMISGPAGIGKTRLAEEVALRARRRGVRVAVGRCWRDGEAPPLWPWHMMLRDLDAPEEPARSPRGRYHIWTVCALCGGARLSAPCPSHNVPCACTR